MKRIFILLPAMLCLALLAFSQKSKSPAKGKAKPQAKATKTVKKAEPIELPLMMRNEDGSTSYYNIQRGDKLVYHVSAGDKEYDFIVPINDEGYEKGIDFSYEMTAPVNTKGHVMISANGKNNSSKYVNYFSGGDLKLSDACTVWMTGKNFSDMPNKQTEMTIDNSAPEIFYRPDNDEVFPVVNLKGSPVKIEGFKINNAADGTGNKTWWINGISSNSLILKMDMGLTIELKEIR